MCRSTSGKKGTLRSQRGMTCLLFYALCVVMHLTTPCMTSDVAMGGDVEGRHSVSECLKEPTSFCSCRKMNEPDIPNSKSKPGGKEKETLKIGILLPFTIDRRQNVGSFNSGEYYASAMCIAVEDINRSKILPNHNLQLIWSNTKCDWKSTVRSQYKMITDESVRAFIGGGCNDDCKIAARVSGAFNIPMISHQCNDPDLTNATNFPTFGRTDSSNGRHLTQTVQQLLEYFHWNKMALVVEGATTYRNIGEHMRKHFQHRDYVVHYKYINETIASYKYTYEEHYPQIKEELRSIARVSRIILLLMEVRFAKEWLIAASELNLLNGSYVFIVFELHLNEGKVHFENSYRWLFDELGPENSEERSWKLCEAWKSALLVMTEIPKGDKSSKLNQFYRRVRTGMNSWFNLSTYMGHKNQSHPPYYAINLYDAIKSYVVAVNKTIGNHGDFNNGSSIIRSMANLDSWSIGGYKINFDKYGDLQFPFLVYHYGQKWEKCTNKSVHHSNTSMEQYLEIDTRAQTPVRIPGTSIYWPNPENDLHKVKDEPECGFHNEHCRPPKKVKDYVGIPVALTVVVMLFVITPVVIYRQYRLEKELANQLWKIHLNQLEFYDWKSSTLSLQSTYASMNQSQTSRRQMVAYYQGNVVNVRKVFKKTVELNHTVLMELKQIRDLRHNNVNPFIGACVDYNNILIVTQYGVRGSLKDVLLKGEIKLDTLFYLSLINDIVKGMRYLHQTDIKSHGNLKSSNCVIDSRWTLKLTDFGLNSFKSKEDLSHMDNAEYHQSLLWHAPELLRITGSTGRGTPKGDVYSFAIIIQEFHTRKGPWSTTFLKAWEIIQRVRNVEDPPFRPPVSALIEKAPALRELMKRCWREREEERPSFKEIQAEMLGVMRENGLKSNMMDNMVELMEKYTNHLEDIVTQRTGELQTEKQKTEALIMQVLPESVARQLIKGQQVEAESFSEVSIYFSDIVGFTALCSDSTPMQIISLLNDLYTLFDRIISHYQVYKVETIGDAYMVVSGLPIRNDQQHAMEISLMALHILNAVKTFTIQHRPQQQLLLRIGLHSGPVVAGVVGKTMPRYCLFGDTVNYSSRMESTGEPLRIHISHPLHQIIDPLGDFVCQKRGETHLKGIGSVTTHWLISSRHPQRESVTSTPSVSVLSLMNNNSTGRSHRSKMAERQLSSPGGRQPGSPHFDFPHSFERTSSLRGGLRGLTGSPNGYMKGERTFFERNIMHHQLHQTNSCM